MFTLLSLFSLLLAAGTVAVWLHPRDPTADYSFLMEGNRYTLHLFHSSARLDGPPAVSQDKEKAAAVAAAVSNITNDDFQWLVWLYNSDNSVSAEIVEPPVPKPGSASANVEQAFTSGDLLRPLLAALEDPSRSIAAHVLLARIYVGRQAALFQITDPTVSSTVTYEEFLFSNGQAIATRINYCGRALTLRLPADAEGPQFSGSVGYWFVAHSDPKNAPATPDHWHQVFDVTIATVSYPDLLAFTLILPALWLATAVRRAAQRRRRRRNGQCLACGYDLRSSPARCPECGRAPRPAPTPAA